MPVKPFAITRPVRLMMVVGLMAMMSLAVPAGAQEPARSSPQPSTATVVDSPGRKKVEKTSRMSLLQLLLKGRWFMVPIGACSLLGLAIIFERALALRYGKVIPRRFMEELKQASYTISQQLYGQPQQRPGGEGGGPEERREGGEGVVEGEYREV